MPSERGGARSFDALPAAPDPLPIDVVDNHVHLDITREGDDPLDVSEAIERARTLGHGAILLVGDAPYYQRFGFQPELTQKLDLPGPVERERFLALELAPGALSGATGMVIPTGALERPLDRARPRAPIRRRAKRAQAA